MSLLKKVVFCWFILINGAFHSQMLIINEFSNGPSGTQEYIEFIVVDTSNTISCTPCLDIRGWIVDDNNGYHGTSGVAGGCNRFSNDLFWSCIPLGTVITIYNGTDPNVDIPTIDIDINDGNCSLVIPIENNTLFETNSNTPNAVTCDYPNVGWTAGGIWSRMGMRNGGDCVRLVDLSGCEVFSFCYGDVLLNSTISFPGPGTDDVFFFSGTDPFSQADWFQGCAGDPGACAGNDQTPGVPNSSLNDSYISQFTVNNCQPITITDTNEVNLSICENELPYSWNGLTFTTTESQTVTLTSLVTGCDSLATLNLTVGPTLTSTTDITICDTELPYTWNGLTFTTAGSQTSSLVSPLSGCDSLATLNLTVGPTLTSTTDITICDTELPYTWNGLTFTNAGSQTSTLVSPLSGCDSLATLNLTVDPTLTSTTDITICDTELPYTWNGLTFTTAGSQTSSLVSPLSGCDSLATLNLTVGPTLTSTTDITICDTELPYTWNGLTFTAAGSQTSTLVSPLSGCDSLATLNLTVDPTLTSTTDITICENELPYTWNGLTFSSSGTQSTNLSSSLGCDSIVTLNLNVNGIDTNTVNLSLCENELPYT
ncbi:MAG: hypothetical protein ISP70_03130, partial [Crocinitomicaceae bacterium]|nr:hypothetical protein [Crocinitomicaceae bacterium]